MVWMFLVSKTPQWGSNENLVHQSIEGNGEADKGVERQSCFNETMTCCDVQTPLILVTKKIMTGCLEKLQKDGLKSTPAEH